MDQSRSLEGSEWKEREVEAFHPLGPFPLFTFSGLSRFNVPQNIVPAFLMEDVIGEWAMRDYRNECPCFFQRLPFGTRLDILTTLQMSPSKTPCAGTMTTFSPFEKHAVPLSHDDSDSNLWSAFLFGARSPTVS
jgi:hypothetical protein